MSVTTASKPLPTAEQLKAYADQLPDIYRELFRTFQLLDPSRRVGQGALHGSLVNSMMSGRYTAEEIHLALGQLEEAGFLVFEDVIGGYIPSRIGEELIAAVTGRRAAAATVPALPKPTW